MSPLKVIVPFVGIKITSFLLRHTTSSTLLNNHSVKRSMANTSSDVNRSHNSSDSLLSQPFSLRGHFRIRRDRVKIRKLVDFQCYRVSIVDNSPPICIRLRIDAQP
ncbi:MAG: hypothetical protein PVH73_10415 [Candidatus Bathyarchaeota archaeon]